MYSTFLDNGLVLQIKTDCSRFSQSKDKKIFTFCQNGKCCSTGALPAQNQRCKQNTYGFGTKYNLGECSKFDFHFDSVEGNVTYHDIASAKDGWTPDWIHLVLGNGAVIKCDGYWALGGWKPHLSGAMLGDGPQFVNFHCMPEGDVSSLILGKYIL